MGELGSIYAEKTSGPRGPDLHVGVEVPRSTLGSEQGCPAVVPAQIEHEGVMVSRVLVPGDPPGRVVLRLPKGFQDGATLRLRGQGGRTGEGAPGDLFVRVTLVDRALEPVAGSDAEAKGPGVVLIGAIVVLAALLVWALLR